jgi:hypothetical protein
MDKGIYAKCEIKMSSEKITVWSVLGHWIVFDDLKKYIFPD